MPVFLATYIGLLVIFALMAIVFQSWALALFCVLIVAFALR